MAGVFILDKKDFENGYKASITREQFLFYEMRIAARLISDGLSDEEAVEAVVKDNLFQYPTEKSIKRMAATCVKRLRAMNDDDLINAIAKESSDVAKQICLYAMMKQNRIVYDFWITVIGEKYRIKDTCFSKMDINIFFMQLQEQNDIIASWSDSTIAKIKQVLLKIMVETEYIDNTKSEKLNPVWLYPVLENGIKVNGDLEMLPAFNCFI